VFISVYNIVDGFHTHLLPCHLKQEVSVSPLVTHAVSTTCQHPNVSLVAFSDCSLLSFSLEFIYFSFVVISEWNDLVYPSKDDIT
jgi:hypothetical protein